MSDFDLAIIGGGTAGYSTALRAAENNLKVALIEKEKLGGTCLHRGCIPTKALIEASSLYSRTKEAGDFGIKLDNLGIDWPRTQQYKTNVVSELYSGLNALIKARSIKLIQGEAKFTSSKEISVNGRQVEADNYIVAVGSRPKHLPFLPASEVVVNSDGMLQITDMPEKLIIIGGGYIGLEFGSLFNGLGTDVTIIEAAPDIMTGGDSQLCRMLAEKLRTSGIKIETNAQIDKVDVKDNQVEVTIGNSATTATFKADRLLEAVGREANTDTLGLDKTDIALDEKGFVKVDQNLRSSAENIFAIGDCINTPQLAHVSFAEGLAVADYVAGQDAIFPNYDAIASAIYTKPQLAWVGLTGQQAEKRGIKTKTAVFNFGANSRAVISHEQEGLVKLIVDESDTILGIHILGPDASNLISEAMLAVGWEAKAEDLANFIHPHPTFSEVIGEAALKLTGKPLHSL